LSISGDEETSYENGSVMVKRGPTLPPNMASDVTLILEGTYPFVSGGVSSWVHQIIKGLPELRFSLVFIGGSPDKYEKMRFELPPNVVHLQEHYLTDVPTHQRVVAHRGDAAFYAASSKLHDAFRASGGDGSAAKLDVVGPMLDGIARSLLENPKRAEHDFLFSELAWEEICRRYEASGKGRSFVEYFWTIRSMHAPLFVLARGVATIPLTRVVHVISTGFAGFMAALLSKARGYPLILTEHGIYTKERRIELLQASWIKDEEGVGIIGEAATIGFFRQLWIRFFEALGKMTYSSSNPIIALYEGNRQRQQKDGARGERTRVVPNGIDLERFVPVRSKRPAGVPKIIGLIGRVVPIKDIKTFIRAARIVCNELPTAEAWIVGPEDEDPNYALECHDIVKNLSLVGKVKFLGFQKVDDIYPQLGLNVLTSISEAQPLVVLEGFAAGTPSVASDVGCCRELIEGVEPADRELGFAGAVVDIADPSATARACIDLLANETKWYAAQRAGAARVERYYTQKQMLDNYRRIYTDALHAGVNFHQARAQQPPSPSYGQR
jgi:polysaccharide biosynthesis protein PelF